MSTLNNLKKIYFLTNQQNDYQRLINLLSQNDIGGVHRFEFTRHRYRIVI